MRPPTCPPAARTFLIRSPRGREAGKPGSREPARSRPTPANANEKLKTPQSLFPNLIVVVLLAIPLFHTQHRHRAYLVHPKPGA